MKRLFAALALTVALASCDVLSKIPTGTGGVTETEAADGIKEALSQGLVKAVLQLNREDGFFKDALYKILLPPDAKKIENTLRDLGMGKMVDKAILQINRAAEDAAGYAKPKPGDDDLDLPEEDTGVAADVNLKEAQRILIDLILLASGKSGVAARLQ